MTRSFYPETSHSCDKSRSHGEAPVKSTRGFCPFALAVLLFLAPIARVSADDPVDRFLGALREDRLDGLLVEYCQRELRRARLTDMRRGMITTAYATHLAARAVETADSKRRNELWSQAHQQFDAALATLSSPEARWSLRFEAAVLDAIHGKWQGEYDELAGKKNGSDDQSRMLLARSLNELTRLESEVETEIDALAKRRITGSDRAHMEALQVLSPSITAKLGGVEVALARTYPLGDELREKLLAKAVIRLTPLATVFGRSSLLFDAAIDLASAANELGEVELAKDVLDRLERSPLTDDQRIFVVAERTEWMLARTDIADSKARALEAAKYLEDQVVDRGSAPPRWDYLSIRLLLEQAAAESGAGATDAERSDARKLQELAFGKLRRLESAQGGIWARRASMLLSKHAADLVGGSYSELERAAESVIAAGKGADAAKIFEQAAAAAHERGLAGEEARLQVRAAGVYQEGKQFRKSSEILAQVAANQSDKAQAAAMHLRALMDGRKAYLAEPNDANLGRLRQELERHLRDYSKEKTADQVRLLFASLRAGERQFQEAIDLAQAVPADHVLRHVALMQASQAYAAWIDEPASADSVRILAEAAAFQTALLADETLAQPKLDAESRAVAALRLARGARRGNEASNRTAEHWLRTMANDASLAPRTRFFLDAELKTVLVRQGRFNEVRRLSAQLEGATPEALAECLASFVDVAWTAPELSRREIAEVAAPYAAKLMANWDGVGATTKRDAELTLAMLGIFRSSEADLASAEAVLLKRFELTPKDGRILEALALCALQQRRYDVAINRWRSAIAAAPTASPAWFRGKLNLATSLRRAGQPAEAAKVVDVLQVLYPELGGAMLRERFMEERKRIEDAQ